MRYWNRWLVACLVLTPAWTTRALAGVVDFVATCLADDATFERLPARLAAQGWVERDPVDGAQGPALAAAAPRRHLWSLPGWNGGAGDAFVGLAQQTTDRPLEVCWHVSRPGESGAEALAELRRRYPPTGAVERGPEFFNGGFERWSIDLAGQTASLSVSWPMLQQPELGASILSIVRAPAAAGKR